MSNQGANQQTPNISLNGIDDIATRENFRALVKYFQANTAMLGFQLRTYQFTAPSLGATYNNPSFKDKFVIPHGLSYKPLDVVLTSLIGSGLVVFNYDLFDAQNIVITVTGTVTPALPTNIRLYLGAHFDEGKI